MNLSVVAVLALVLAVPAVLRLADGSIDPDAAGLRVLLAVLVAGCAEVVLRRFVQAVRRPSEQPQGDPPAA